MALDGLVTRAVIQELQTCVGGRISKIHQPTGHDIVMSIRSQSNNYKLLLSANTTYPRVHYTEQTFHNPTEAPMFCMLLRKHCEGAIIEAIEQVGMERIIHLDVRHRDELGDISTKRIIIELMGRHSNIILMDPVNGNILDGIHHVTPAISSYRIVLPGSPYTSPPEQHKLHPLLVTKSTLTDALECSADTQIENEPETAPKSIEQRIVDQFSGISPLVAKEIVFRSQQTENSRAKTESVWLIFHEIMEAVRNHVYVPNIKQHNSTGKAYFSILDLTHIPGQSEAYPSISTCLEAFYGEKAQRDTIKQRTLDLARFLQNERNKNVKKIDKLQETLEEAKDADKYRIAGELLTASMHLMQRGDRQVEVINYYDEEQRTMKIEIDPLLTPSDNAQKYFKKYTKTKNSYTVVQEQMAETYLEITYLETLIQQLNNASMNDIEEIREELIEQGYLRDRQKKGHKKKKPGKPTVTCYTSSEGISIYVGKNNIQNEYVTQRLARSSDTWLHTKDIPGSHVVISSDAYGEATLHEAAQLAATFSQARESSQVPVDYTLIRHVRKPNGAKPGFVIYDHQKTLFVTPDENLVKNLPHVMK